MAGFDVGAVRAMMPSSSMSTGMQATQGMQGADSQRPGALGIRSDALKGLEGTTPSGGSSGVGSVPATREGSFADLLDRAAGELEASLSVADKKSLELVMGQDVAVHDVMAAVTEAEIAVQMTSAIAVKAIQAYQEIWRMEI
jgi:flagellar hook-basal body complex protein FliE